MSNKTNYQFLRDPIVLSRVLWPHVKYYNKQIDVIYSVWHNIETDVIAGNMLGKDFIAGRIALMFFLTRSPCRILTTSVDHTQLEGVLWGEIREAIQEAKVPILDKDGGPLVYNHLHIRKRITYGPLKGELEPKSELIGRQAKKGEGMAGLHIAEKFTDDIPRTLLIADEASGLDDLILDRAETWADRLLLIGNPYPCSNRFWKASEGDGLKDKGGDILSKRKVKYWEGITLWSEHDTKGTPLPPEKVKPVPMVQQYSRKVIHISCEDSPNVRYAKEQEKVGVEITNDILVPGVMSYWKFKDRENKWDEVKKCIQLYGRFYKGKHTLLFPPQNLNKSERLVDSLRFKRRVARAIGCDPGEGSAETAWYVVDDYGILEEVALQTLDTTEIFDTSIFLMRKWNVEPYNLLFDAGGGGKQHSDYLRRAGHDVSTIWFNESLQAPPQTWQRSAKKQKQVREEKGVYKNRRAMMYGHLSDLIEPMVDVSQGVVSDYPSPSREFSDIDGEPLIEPDTRDPQPRFCIPSQYRELRRQLALMPKLMDGEGKLYLPSKNRTEKDTNKKEKTLSEIIGCSPDRADALVLAVFQRDYGRSRIRAGAAT
jgi:hypothetical protein